MILYICKKEEGYLANRKGNEMETTIYERLLSSVNTATVHADKMNEVVAYLRQHPTEGVTNKDIGLAIYGEEYVQNPTFPKNSAWNRNARSLAGHLGALLGHLQHNGYVKRTTVNTNEPVVDRNGKIVTTEVIKTVPRTDNNEPYKIKVHDEQGREFYVTNPFYDGPNYRYVREQQIVYKKVTRFFWTGMED